MKTNKIGIEITRPTQELIVMRGIPGAGKSTRAKELVGEGEIHSTDALIEASGDYRAFFQKMIESKSYMALGWKHKKNLNNATRAVADGVSPVIVDNTNIKHADAKAYVVMALEAGLADENIKFEDVGTAGLDAETLAGRNTHGVPLDKIQAMMASHKGQGEITLESVLNKKDMYKEKPKSDISYSCVLFGPNVSNALLEQDYPIEIPSDWKKYAHHMTINLGELKDKSKLNRSVALDVFAVGISDKAMAVKVRAQPWDDQNISNNAIPHITLAVNPDGGKPVMSNDITKWQDIKVFTVVGVVTEIKYEK
jgi:predicted kinase